MSLSEKFKSNVIFTGPTKEDWVPKLATASLCIHGSRGAFSCLPLPLTIVFCSKYIDSLL